MNRLKIYAALIITALLMSIPTLSRDSLPAMGKQRKGDIHSFSVYLKMGRLKFYSSEEVILHVVIKNITGETASFYVFDVPGREDLFNNQRGDVADFNTFKPVIYDMNGRTAELSVPYIVSGKDVRETLSWMTRREIRLGPGESFTRTLNLGRMYKLQSETDYRIKLRFFPFIGDTDEDKILISDNELKVRIARDREYEPCRKAVAEGVRLVPSEVVILLLEAEKDGYWERAVRFIDIEKFIHSYPDFSRKYDLADDPDKKIIEKDFIRYFISKRSDYLIDFQVVSEEVEPSGLVSYVSVVASRKSLIKPARYRYVYRLEKNSIDDYIWMVSGLEATVVREVKK